MTRPKDSSPQRLSPEIELQVRTRDLSQQIQQLEVNYSKHGAIYFLDKDEMFSLDFNRGVFTGRTNELAKWAIGISPYETIEGDIYGTVIKAGQKSTSVEHYGERTFYYPPINFTIAELEEDDRLYGMDGRSMNSTDEIDSLIEIVKFMNISGESSFKNPLTDIFVPEALKRLITRIREAPRMRFVYKKPEFYSALRRVGDKATEVEDIDKSRYERRESVVLATTGWVKVEKDGEEFELRFETVDRVNNGSYTKLDEVSRREVGDEGEGKYLFDESQLWSVGFDRIRTVERLQECIDMINLLDENIPAPGSASS